MHMFAMRSKRASSSSLGRARRRDRPARLAYLCLCDAHEQLRDPEEEDELALNDDDRLGGWGP